MSTSTLTAHDCICLDKAPLLVDGDTGAVYHENCEGYIADVDDFPALTDKFWNDQMQNRDNAFIINGEQYRTGVEYPQKGYGMGGDHHRIEIFENGDWIDTKDLWHQGKIPAEYRGILQDNARFVRMIPVVHYRQCTNCKKLMNRDKCFYTTCNNAPTTSAESIEVKNV